MSLRCAHLIPPRKRAPSAALSGQFCCEDVVVIPFPRTNRVPHPSVEFAPRRHRYVDKALLRSLSSFSVFSSSCGDGIEVQVYEALAFKAPQPPFSTIGTNGTKVSLLTLECSQLMVCEQSEKVKP
jgi:hypothetical protein